MPRHTTAAIAVDIQPDFQPGGALAVTDGHAVVEPMLAVKDHVDLFVASRDFHPVDHVSFVSQRPVGGDVDTTDDASTGGRYIWPDHCVAGTPGARIDERIDAVADLVVSKGTDRLVDAYSAFNGTGLADMLRARGVTGLVVGGLATDYCVLNTVLDGLSEGFDVTVVEDAIRAVDVQEGDGERAIERMREAGASVQTLDEWLHAVHTQQAVA